MNYRAKAIASFETKLKLFIYNTVVNEGGNFDAEKFHNFSIGEELVKEYTTVYWQREKVYKIKEKSIDDIKEKSIDDIYKNMNALIADNKANIDALKNEYIINQFPTIFSEVDFKEITSKNYCHYCEISKCRIEKLVESNQLYKKSLRGWNLEIDRLNSNYEYSKDNCVMACYWCNNAKTDEFTEDEFKKIGKVIGEIWKNRLHKKE